MVDAIDLMELYKKAWEKNDPDLISEIFTQEAEYWETPFGPILKGIEEITRYWEKEALVYHNVSFRYGLISENENYFYALWQCECARQSTQTPLEMKGIFFCQTSDGRISQLIEYWHKRDYNGTKELC